jgi:RsiW-degrading membrane proteinase PrsW (M82 family)
MPFSFNTWQLIGLIIVSALMWMHYVQMKDRHRPEPVRRLWQSFLLGIAAALAAMLGYQIAEWLGVPGIQFGEKTWTAVYCFLLVGPLEEGAKVLVAMLVVFRWAEFDEPVDGFVYAAAISLGFASVENFHNLEEASWTHQLARAAALPITHTLFSAIWGFGIGHARFGSPRPAHPRLWVLGSIALAMAAHGLYDYLIFAFQATLLTGGIALGLWALVIWRARDCVRREP